MDTLAHGLWGGIAFGRKEGIRGRRGTGVFFLALLIGMLPDLLSFGPRFVTWALAGFPPHAIEPGTRGAPAMASFSPYVLSAYNVTHSLVVWTAAFAVLWLIFRRRAWLFGAWGLHILCDIPTHSTRFFPTPFLWPFPTPYVNGISWGTPWFMIANYTSLAVGLAVIFFRRRSYRPPADSTFRVS